MSLVVDAGVVRTPRNAERDGRCCIPANRLRGVIPVRRADLDARLVGDFADLTGFHICFVDLDGLRKVLQYQRHNPTSLCKFPASSGDTEGLAMLPFTLRAVDGRLVRNPSVATPCQPSLYHYDPHCRAVLKRTV